MTKSKVQYSFWFYRKQLSDRTILDIVTGEIGIIKQRLEIAYNAEKFDIKRIEDYLVKKPDKIRIVVSDKSTQDSLSIFSLKEQMFVGVFLELDEGENPLLVNKLTELEPVLGYGCSYLDEAIQNSNTLGHFKTLGVDPPKHLIPFTDKYGDVCYDISANPGLSVTSAHGIWFMACWRMWLGKPVVDLVDVKKIESIPLLSEAKFLPGGVFYIEIHSNVQEAHLPENREKQKSIRDIMNPEYLSTKF